MRKVTAKLMLDIYTFVQNANKALRNVCYYIVFSVQYGILYESKFS